jgi:hypothetical protein
MKKRSSLLILIILLLSNWTVLSAQITDSTACYKKQELQKIAVKLVKYKECDSLYKLQEKQILIKDSIILKQSQIIIIKDTIINNHKSISNIKDIKIDNLEESLNDEKNRHKITKIGLLGSIVAFFSYIFIK